MGYLYEELEEELQWELDDLLENHVEAARALLLERRYQRQRWGDEHDKKHTPEEWLNILTIYMGKLGVTTPMYQQRAYDLEKTKKRLIQIAAIALAAWETLSSAAPPTDKG